MKGLYSIKDHAVGVYMTIFEARTDEEAMRHIATAVQNPESLLAKHPRDFSLHRVGFFDEDTGVVQVNGQEPVNLASDLTQFLIRKDDTGQVDLQEVANG